MRLVARRSMLLSGIGDLRPGDEFTVPDHIGRALKAVGKAKDVSVAEDQSLMPTYRTRAMQSPVHATATAEAEAQTQAAHEAQAEPQQAEQQHEEDEEDETVRREHVIQALRVRAAALGLTPDGRWGEIRLRQEIAMAQEQLRYGRRDMRPEE